MVGAVAITIVNLVIGTASNWQSRLVFATACALNPHPRYKSEDMKHFKVIINMEEGCKSLKLLYGSVARSPGWLVVRGWLIQRVLYSESFLRALWMMERRGFRSAKAIQAAWLTQAMGGAEPEVLRQSVHVGGAGGRQGQAALSVACRGVHAGLRVVPGSPHM